MKDDTKFIKKVFMKKGCVNPVKEIDLKNRMPTPPRDLK